MLKLKQNHTPRDVKVLTDQLVDAVSNTGFDAGVVTLTGSTSTIVTAPRATANSFVVLTPCHANAQGVDYWISVDSGSFTVNHTSDAVADKTFGYLVLGR